MTNDKRVALDEIIEAAMQLPPEQLDVLIEALRQRKVDIRREEMAQSASSAIAALREGQLIPQSVESIIADLRQPPEEQEQRAAYTALLQSLGPASFDEISEVLDDREVVEPEPGLTPELVARLRAKLTQD